MVQEDWNEVWSDGMKKNQASYQNIHWSHRWNDGRSALRFNTHAIGMRDHSVGLVEGLPVNRDDHVLEIGPGTGPLTIPLSFRVEQITAVEPSPYMGDMLKRNLVEQQIPSVSIIQKRWEEVDPDHDLNGQYDLVLASHSLGMNDLKSALRKMDDVSCGFVYLLWFFDSSFMEHAYIRLWPLLHGKKYEPLPKADLIYKILLQMGIHPEFEPYVTVNKYHYRSMEEAVRDLSINFGIFDGSSPHILEEFIRENCTFHDNEIHITGRSTNAKIWWKKGTH